LRDWFVGGAVVTEGEDFQCLPAPEPDFRHIESTVDLELTEAARGEGDFKGEIGKLLFLMKTLQEYRSSGVQEFRSCRIQDSGFRIQDSGFRIQDSGFRIQDSGVPWRQTKISSLMEF
jgi:hypothetical protein